MYEPRIDQLCCWCKASQLMPLEWMPRIRLMISVIDATLVPAEPSNIGRKTLMESEVGSPKTHSARALMAQTMHLTSLPWGLLTHPTQWPWCSISTQPGDVSTCPNSLWAGGSLGAAETPHGAGRAGSHNQGNWGILRNYAVLCASQRTASLMVGSNICSQIK